MLKFIATTILCFLIHPLWAQEVSNVQVEQNGEELKITFDIAGTEEDYLVTIELAEDGEHFKIFGEFNGRRGKNEFRKELNEQIYLPTGVFRVSSLIMISDIDGNKYKTIKIGNQEWMKENLRVRKYRNGDPIPTNLTDAAWDAASKGAYAIYNNDAVNNETYGKLYNWYAVVDSRNLCPVGWHVPSDGEWKTLEIYLGMSTADADLQAGSPRGSAKNVGGKLKSTCSLWDSPNKGATDESGFSGLPGGYRYYNGTFYSIGNYCNWWSSTQYLSSSTGCAWNRKLYDNFDISSRGFSGKSFGFSVRCLRD